MLTIRDALCCTPLLLTTATGARATASTAEPPARLVESPLSSHLVDTAGGLLLVVGLMLALAWLVKRYVQVPGIGKGQVQILGGVSLGAREKAVLLSVEGRRLLVGIAPGRVQTLLVLGDGKAPAPDFAEQLGEASRQADREAAS
jgi:flagellar protein FliO/FliZ